MPSVGHVRSDYLLLHASDSCRSRLCCAPIQVYSRNMEAHDPHYFLRPEFAESTWMVYKATKK